MVFLIFILGVTMTGCKNRRDLEDDCYVMALGFEKINDRYLVRYSYADFDSEKSDSGTKVPSRSVTYLADSFAGANEKWQKDQQKPLNFGHLKVVIFGGEKEERIIKELLEDPQIAKSVYVLESDQSITDLFSVEKDLPISFGEYMASAVENSSRIEKPENKTLGRILY
jgi:hypothetical protein